MRQTLCLAVIFFGALVAQASATTIIECAIEKKTGFPSRLEMRLVERWPPHSADYTLSYNVGKGSKIKNLSLKGCRIINNKSDELSIDFSCAPTVAVVKSKFIVDRLTGKFLYQKEYLKPNIDDDMAIQETGSCRKVKQKF